MPRCSRYTVCEVLLQSFLVTDVKILFATKCSVRKMDGTYILNQNFVEIIWKFVNRNILMYTLLIIKFI